MKRLAGIEITEDMPRLSTETAIERPADSVQILWRYWETSLKAPSYHGTANVFDLGDISEAQ